MTTNDVRNRLRAVLNERHWSQQDLADLSGLPYPTVRRLVSGGRNPPLDLALAVCGALGLDLEDVYWLEKRNTEADDEATASGREQRALSPD